MTPDGPRALFVDDMPVRHRVASQWLPKHHITHAHDAYEGVGMYLFGQSSLRPFALVSLDRDLGQPRSGEDIVDMVLKLHTVLPDLVRPAFAIHSWNIPAAERMENRLKWAGFDVTRQPFSPPAYIRHLDKQK